MKILMFSEDPSLASPSSAARVRMRRFSELFSELHIIFLTGNPGVTERDKNLFLYPARSRLPFLNRFRAYRIGRACSRASRFDYVSVQSPNELGLLGYIIARARGIPFQVQIHADIMSPWYARNSWKERIRYRIGLFLIPRADCIRVVSARIKESIVERFGQRIAPKISVLPIFTDLKRFIDAPHVAAADQNASGDAFKLVAAGRFVDKEKNFSMLIRAMHEVTKHNAGVVLTIVGDGPDRAKYRHQIIRYHLEKNVFLGPWQKDMFSLYKSFDAFVLPSWHEGWGVAVLEAMASGVPIIMTDVGCAGEVVENQKNGLVVPVGDTAALVAAIEELHRDRTKRESLVRNAAATVSKVSVSWDEYASRYRQTFERCGHAR